MQLKKTALAIGLAMSVSPLTAWSQTSGADMQKMQQSISHLQQQLNQLQKQLAEQKARNDKLEAKQASISKKQKTQDKTVASVKKKTAIHVGGAARFNYTWKQYDQASRNTQGDLNFDTFRINLDGQIDDVILSAEWRYYNYMQTIHHAWVGYKFTPDWIVRAGVVKVPFGNLPYNSNSYYFSSNFYIGLEDFYDLGVSTTYKTNDWRFDFAFLKNNQPNGYGSDSYTENVVGYDNGVSPTLPDGSTNPNYSQAKIKPINSFDARAEYTWKPTDSLTVKPGVSALYGSLTNGSVRQGNYHAYAAHVNADWNRWNVKLQYTDFDYSIDDSSAKRLLIGGYAYKDYAPTKGKSATGELAYTLPVNWGPISSLKFYNDYSRIYSKNDGMPVTWMNVTGMAMAAGPVYAYFDFVQAKNQPFVGGSTGPVLGTDGGLNRLFNINVGYYF